MADRGAGGGAGGATAVVVGSGPNGLAAALVLARAGVRVVVLERGAVAGGGLRSTVGGTSGGPTLPGLVHDECAGFFPLTLGNAFHRTLDHAAYDVDWVWAPHEFSHPLPGGRGAVLDRSVAETAVGLGTDGPAWQRVFGPLVDDWERAREEVLGPVVHLPRDPVPLVRFGWRAPLPALAVAARFRTAEARALWLGVAGHGFLPPTLPFTSAAALALTTSGHAVGWPAVRGGSGRLAAGLVRMVTDAGGRVVTGQDVRHPDDLVGVAGPGRPDLVLLDTGVGLARDFAAAADPSPRGLARARRLGATAVHRTGVVQVSLAVDGGIPWSHEPSRSAAVVHVGGTPAEQTASARALWRGELPARPYVLVGQQHVADPGRGVGSVVPVDLYAHVPAGWPAPAATLTALVLRRLEEHAPGLRDRVLAVATRPPRTVEADDPNFVGGDISTGAVAPLPLLLGPRPGRPAYTTGVPGTYLCSAATPPGPGAHGMGGWHAAHRALADLAR